MSPSVNSYGILNPSAPNFLLSSVTPWNSDSEKINNLKSPPYNGVNMSMITNLEATILQILNSH